MGLRECFLYSTNDKYTAEKLAGMLVDCEEFKGEYPPFWLVCKSVAVNDLHKETAVVFEQVVDISLDLKAGQEFLCIGYESGNSVKDCFPFYVKKDLVVIESWMLGDMNYSDVMKDEPIEVNGKNYFAELNTDDKGDSVNDLISDATAKVVQNQSKDVVDVHGLDI